MAPSQDRSNPEIHQTIMGRHFIIVDDKHRDDGYRREEMYRRMGGNRMTNGGVRMENYRDDDECDYDDGYRRGYEHGFKDHEMDENWRRMRDSRGRFM